MGNNGKTGSQQTALVWNKDNLSGLLKREDFMESLRSVCTKYLTPDRVMKLGLLAASRQPKLWQCTVSSFLQAVMRLLLLSLAVCGPLLLAQVDCPQPDYLPLTGYTVAFDPNQIAWDHADDPNDPPRRRLLREPVRLVLGQTARIEGYACDPDGDAVQLDASGGQVALAAQRCR